MTDVLMDKSMDLSSCAEKMELVFICMKNKSIMLGGSFLVLPVAEKIPCGWWAQVQGCQNGLLWHVRGAALSVHPEPQLCLPRGPRLGQSFSASSPVTVWMKLASEKQLSSQDHCQARRAESSPCCRRGHIS